jgi:hypothetical protein
MWDVCHSISRVSLGVIQGRVGFTGQLAVVGLVRAAEGRAWWGLGRVTVVAQVVAASCQEGHGVQQKAVPGGSAGGCCSASWQQSLHTVCQRLKVVPVV